MINDIILCCWWSNASIEMIIFSIFHFYTEKCSFSHSLAEPIIWEVSLILTSMKYPCTGFVQQTWTNYFHFKFMPIYHVYRVKSITFMKLHAVRLPIILTTFANCSILDCIYGLEIYIATNLRQQRLSQWLSVLDLPSSTTIYIDNLDHNSVHHFMYLFHVLFVDNLGLTNVVRSAYFVQLLIICFFLRNFLNHVDEHCSFIIETQNWDVVQEVNIMLSLNDHFL